MRYVTSLPSCLSSFRFLSLPSVLPVVFRKRTKGTEEENEGRNTKDERMQGRIDRSNERTKRMAEGKEDTDAKADNEGNKGKKAKKDKTAEKATKAKTAQKTVQCEEVSPGKGKK